MTRRVKVSDEDLREAAQAGLSRAETARRYGVGETTIKRRAAQAGIEFRPGRLGPNERVAGLTSSQREDIKILVTQAGYSNVDARELVLRPRPKVRATPHTASAPEAESPPRPASVRKSAPVRSRRLSASPAAIARHFETNP